MNRTNRTNEPERALKRYAAMTHKQVPKAAWAAIAIRLWIAGAFVDSAADLLVLRCASRDACERSINAAKIRIFN